MLLGSMCARTARAAVAHMSSDATCTSRIRGLHPGPGASLYSGRSVARLRFSGCGRDSLAPLSFNVSGIAKRPSVAASIAVTWIKAAAIATTSQERRLIPHACQPYKGRKIILTG